MKRLRLFTLLFIVALFVSISSINAQTFQKDLHATVNNEYVGCLNKRLSGEWTYHIAYHVDKKTGTLTNVHWNIKHCDLWDADGNKYVCIDTGSDNIGSFMWDLFNNINAYNEGYDVYYDNVEDGWLPIPAELPDEGHLVGAVFKFIGNGEKVTWTTLWKINRNAKGEITAEIYSEKMDCN